MIEGDALGDDKVPSSISFWLIFFVDLHDFTLKDVPFLFKLSYFAGELDHQSGKTSSYPDKFLVGTKPYTCTYVIVHLYTIWYNVGLGKLKVLKIQKANIKYSIILAKMSFPFKWTTPEDNLWKSSSYRLK